MDSVAAPLNVFDGARKLILEYCFYDLFSVELQCRRIDRLDVIRHD